MLVALKPDNSMEVLEDWPENFMQYFALDTLVYDPADPTFPWMRIGDSGWAEVPYDSLPAKAKTIQLLYPMRNN